MTDLAATEDHGANLAVLFERQARTTPNATAIVAEREWSYDALLARMFEFARGLAHQDLPPESTVGVRLSRDGDMVALLLAIHWCGLAYVPIDPDDPPARACQILTIAECRLLVAPPDAMADIRKVAVASPLPAMIDPAGLIVAGATGQATECAPGHDRLAYVLFTSGSTGAPKGVEIEHRQLVNLLLSACELIEFTESDRYLAVATIAFDVSVVELFLPLITGGSLLLRDRSLLLDPARLCADIAAHAVTVVQLGPSSWSIIVASGHLTAPLKVAITTGEAVSPALAAQLAQVAQVAWNLYGPTEITVWATGHRLHDEGAGDALASTISAPIGTPLKGYATTIVDETGAAVPDGTTGELFVGGAGVARGYRGKPDLTATRFIALGHDGARHYRTGDLAMRDADGILHYFGRDDDQIKVRGVRIEPREIDVALMRIPNVDQAAATWFETTSGARGLVTAVVWKPGRAMPFEKLHAALSELLPRSLVPSRFVAMERLPLSASGKIDRQAVREALAHDVVPIEPGYLRSMTMSETEARLSQIWERNLGLDRITNDAHFFSVGGDSLSAISMIQDAERSFEVQLDPNIIWDSPRLFDFARRIDNARAQPDDLRNRRVVFPLVREGAGPPLFFSNIDLALARPGRWTPDCQLFALTQWAHGTGFIKANSIAELVRAQLAEIRQIQPEGPYRLGGYSMGGLIALEIAQQLRRAGEEVELLFLLDPMMPVRFQSSGSDLVETAPGIAQVSPAGRIRRQLAALVRDPVNQVGPTRRLVTRELQRARLWRHLSYTLVDLHGRRPGRLTRLLLPRNRWPAFWFAAGRLARDYVALPYDGTCLAVFTHREERSDVWASLLAGPADMRIVEASHLGMMTEPALGDWMTLLAGALQGTSQYEPTPPRAPVAETSVSGDHGV